MNATHPRETFIALKARKEGHQIASEIINPHMDVPPELRQPVPVEQIDPFEGEVSYQPDYRGVYDPCGPVVPYESITDPHVPPWLWPVLGLQILALVIAVILIVARFM